MPHQITITVKPDGTLTTEVSGIAGASCKDVSAWLDKLGKTLADKPTEDYYKPEQQITDAWTQQ
jgi:hypothetical protein